MKKKNVAVLLPGSYDPPTIGHLSLIEHAARTYERVFVVAFVNPKKTYTFTPEERVEMLRLMTEHLPNASVGFSEGLVIDYAKEHGVSLLIKGYRNETDLAYERSMADWNKDHNPRFVTELIASTGRYANVSSTDVRNAMKEGKDLSCLVHPDVISILSQKTI